MVSRRVYKPRTIKRFKKSSSNWRTRRVVFKRGRLIHYFKRVKKDVIPITDLNFLAVKSSVSDGTYNQFRLDYLPNYTDFTNLYDSYKICGISKKYIFDRNSGEAVTANSELPRLITVNDFNDTTALASENEALEYASCKQTRLDKVVKRYFRPTQRLNNVSEVVKSRWNMTTEPDQIHFGIKEAVIATTNTGGKDLGTLHIYTTFYIACRTPK